MLDRRVSALRAMGVTASAQTGQARFTPGNHIDEDHPEDCFKERGRTALGKKTKRLVLLHMPWYGWCHGSRTTDHSIRGRIRAGQSRVAKTNHSLDFYIYTHI